MPRIQMTTTVKVALFCLRLYLVLMLVLIAFKFIRDFSRAGTVPKAPEKAVQAPR